MGCARGGLATPTTSPFMDVVQLGHAMKGVFMSVCVPVRSMKNTAEFAELVERERGCSPELCDPNRSWKRGLTAITTILSPE